MVQTFIEPGGSDLVVAVNSKMFLVDMATRSEGPGSLWTLRIWARLRDGPFTVQMGVGGRRVHHGLPGEYDWSSNGCSRSRKLLESERRDARELINPLTVISLTRFPFHRSIISLSLPTLNHHVTPPFRPIHPIRLRAFIPRLASTT